MQELGFKAAIENKVSSTSEAEGKTKSETVSTGPIQDLGTAISGVLGSFLPIASLGISGPFIIVCCCVCCLLVCSIVLAKSGGGGDDGPKQFPGHRGGQLMQFDIENHIIGAGMIGVDFVSDIFTSSSSFLAN